MVSDLDIIFEDEWILVVNKPAGLMVEPDRNNHPNLLNKLRSYLKSKDALNKDPYAQHLHRLDRPVSGVILFTKKREVLNILSNQFAERKVSKFYHALTEKVPENLSGTLEHWHRKEKKKAELYDEQVDFSERAILSYKISQYNKYFLWEINLLTGKFHQIRAQLASVNCPIIGDQFYGSELEFRNNAIALHASQLDIEHPFTNEKISLVSKHTF